MGDVLDFQKWKKQLTSKKSEVDRKKREQTKETSNVVDFKPMVKLNYLTDELGTQINLDTIKFMTLNKDTFTIFLWFSEMPVNKGQLLSVPYDLAIAYGDLDTAFASFKEIEEAVRQSRGLD